MQRQGGEISRDNCTVDSGKRKVIYAHGGFAGRLLSRQFRQGETALEEFETGESVRILLDDGEAVKNVPRSLKAEGHQLLSLKETPEGYFILVLKKGED